jgi:FkbM family methyltransferase
MINKHQAVGIVKRLIYPMGEPYIFAGKTLKFKAGSRPVRRKYVTSANYITRNDVLQINYLEKNFGQQDVLWDIGSHYGHYSIFAASVALGTQQVFSFEPNTDARKIQVANLKLNNLQNKVSVLDVAVSNNDGYEHFSSKGGNANAHLVKGNGDSRHKKVQCTSLDSLANRLPLPTFVKIDTEGAEIDILSTAGRLLEDKKVTFICELHPFAWKYFNANFDQLLAILSRYNRIISFIDPDRSTKDLPFYGTVLF